MRKYGSAVKDRDIIDVWLDLKNDNCLSFGKNNEKYGKAFDIPCDKKFRLAVNVRHGKMSIEEFEVTYGS